MNGSADTLKATLSIFVCLVFCQPSELEARPRAMRFERLSIEEGLSQSVVNALLQDRVGFLWLGTQRGLNRYDGYDFKVYRHDAENPSSIPHDLILALEEEPDGDLWVGTEGGGLARWLRSSDSFVTYRHTPEDPTSLSEDRIVDLVRDDQGRLWAATFSSGLERLDPTTPAVASASEDAAGQEVFHHFRHDNDNPGSLIDDRVRTLAVDSGGQLWVGTLGGLDLFRPESRSFRHFQHDPNDPHSLSDNRVRAIFEDRRGALWVGTHGGLNRLVDRERGRFERFAHDPQIAGSLSNDWIRSLYEDRDGRLWIGTDGGLNLWRGDLGHFDSYHPEANDPHSLGTDQVVRIYQDRSGVLWISTVGAGVSKWNPRTWSFSHYRSDRNGRGATNGRSDKNEQSAINGRSDDGDRSSDMVFAISEGPTGGLWVGTFGGGLEHIDRTTGARQRQTHDPNNPRSLADDRVTALLHDRLGTLWVGTVAGGLHRQEPEEASTRVGFERFQHDPSNPDSLSNNAVTTLFEDRRGRLWIGTHGGGLNLYQGEAAFTRFQHAPRDPTSLSNDRVMSIAEDAQGRLWLATDGGGLNRLHPATTAFLRILHDPETPDSLSSNELHAVHADRAGRLWIATKSSGLDQLLDLDEASGQAIFQHYSQSDGLPDETIYGIRSEASGGLWLATNSGLARLDPETGAFKTYTVNHGLQSNEFNVGAVFSSPSGELFFGGVNGLNAFFPDRIATNRTAPPVVVTSFSKVNRPVPLDRRFHERGEIELGYRDYFFAFEFAALDFTAPEENRYRYKLEGFDSEWVDLGHRRQVTFTNLDPGRYTLRLQASNNEGFWNLEGTSVGLLIAAPPWATWWAWTLYGLLTAVVIGGLIRRHRREVERERAIAHRERAQSTERQRLLEQRDRLIAELEVKNAELERFNYTVSHDLKSPLVTIKGFLGLLSQDATSGNLERLDHDIRRISSAADQMHRLLGELLELSRLGRQTRPPEKVALSRLVPEALEIIEGQVAERGVEVVVSPSLPEVYGDPLRLLQLFQNLLSNAVKYMGDQNSPKIEVGVRAATPRPGAQLDSSDSSPSVLFVRDNGVGIEERYHHKVFGLFERLESTADGTGVGLALAKRIVEIHGGRIWVESEGKGSGSTFCFTLAAQRLKPGDAWSPKKPSSEGAEPTEEPAIGRVVEAGSRFRSGK